ncbi:uncharacterized protein TNCV_4272321 [Trichonephila clavipes]|nr:uncharacterized protein TNCV_4272321 [Trichonephila clavipes]
MTQQKFLQVLETLRSLCLRLQLLQVPDSVEVGQVARLVCVFDEEQDDLYSVKWYKDDVEFFRFLPNDRPANQFFEIGDVDVDVSTSIAVPSPIYDIVDPQDFEMPP